MGRRETIITIHGVNPDPWQCEIDAVLVPHFDHAIIWYTEYDGPFGPVRAVCHPVALVAAGVFFLAAIAAFASHAWLVTLGLLLGSVALFVAGSLIAMWQRRATARRVARSINTTAATSRLPGPHLVAHSFGTFMTMRALKLPTTKFNRVILVGSVLPRNFEWASLFTAGRHAFNSLQHEIASKDSVVRLVGYIRWLGPIGWFTRELGDAGLRGLALGARVHATRGSWASCETEGCATPPAKGVVHNVPLGELGHSDIFLGPIHAKQLWLPYLWGFSAGEYDRYLKLCCDIVYGWEDGLPLWRQRVRFDELAESEWAWTYHMPTVAFVERSLLDALPAGATDGSDLDELVLGALAVSCAKVIRAYEGGTDVSVQKAMYPPYALQLAVDKIVEAFR